MLVHCNAISAQNRANTCILPRLVASSYHSLVVFILYMSWYQVARACSAPNCQGMKEPARALCAQNIELEIEARASASSRRLLRRRASSITCDKRMSSDKGNKLSNPFYKSIHYSEYTSPLCTLFLHVYEISRTQWVKCPKKYLEFVTRKGHV